MKKLATYVVAGVALIATPAFAADMAVKAPPAPAPIPTWTGFYGGIQFGGGWGDEAVNYSGNDPLTADLLSGVFFGTPAPNGYRISQSGPVGGVEAGYNWQWSSWVLGVEADFSLAGMNGRASGTSLFNVLAGPIVVTQTTTAEQSTDWYGTVRGRAGWLATPNLLLFGTGGFAYGRVAGSANYMTAVNETGVTVTFGNCITGVTCFAGSSSAIRTGWTAGGGIEYLFDQHWSAKVEYQFVDLGDQTVLVPALAPGPFSSFNAVFHDRFNVVRVGLNYQFH